jgi:hypothetical protein
MPENPEITKQVKAEMEKMSANRSTAQHGNPNSGKALVEPNKAASAAQQKLSKDPNAINNMRKAAR